VTATFIPRVEYLAVDRYALNGAIPLDIAVRGRELIKNLFENDTLCGTVAPDDGGLMFYWAAQEMSLTVIVYGHTCWWSARNLGSCGSFSGSGADLPLDRLKNSLRWFSEEVVRRKGR
jgi:hypothetical protein